MFGRSDVLLLPAYLLNVVFGIASLLLLLIVVLGLPGVALLLGHLQALVPLLLLLVDQRLH